MLKATTTRKMSLTYFDLIKDNKWLIRAAVTVKAVLGPMICHASITLQVDKSLTRPTERKSQSRPKIT